MFISRNILGLQLSRLKAALCGSVTILLVLLLAACQTGTKQDAASASPSPRFALIPYPQTLTEGEGTFKLTPETSLRVAGPDGIFGDAVGQVQHLIQQAVGHAPSVSKESKNGAIELVYDSTVAHPEGYGLQIDASGITITAKSGAGVFRATQTLRQLLPAVTESSPLGEVDFPAVSITDFPVYNWRGMHLDVSRHFFSLDYVRKFIDAMALYKFNKLHFHLTDDQGWRIEIKKYPKLTENGAWREFNNHDSTCMERSKNDPSYNLDSTHIIQRDGKTLYGGFYTQDEIRGLVAYAAARHIDIIPEIDMPGHMMAAIKQYPYLACNAGGASWGKTFSVPICPCNEETFRFAEDVYSEIFTLFPSEYVHLGADEVEKTSWGTSAACKAVMKANNLKDLNALQSYFVRRMEGFFHSKGKKLIGWDEILEGGVTSSAVIMYWRGWVPEAPVTAAKQGNKVIMTPGNPLYFDNAPDERSLEAVYNFDPVPAGLDEKSAANIIGAQANTWTEFIPNEARVDYMVFPRMTALSEVLWTHRRDFAGYSERLLPQYERLERLNIQYRLPDLKGLVQKNVFTDKATVTLTPPVAGLVLRYTLDGSMPDATAAEVKGALTFTETTTLHVAAFTKSGRRGDVYTLVYEKQAYAAAQTVSDLHEGLALTYHKGFFKNTAGIKPAADTTLTVTGIVVPEKLGKGSFGLRYRGYINVPAQGVYNFFFTCDDGGVLRIADRLVVDNDGLHGPIRKSGGVALDKGLHTFALDFVEGGGGFTLDLKYSQGTDAPAAVPASWWQTP